MLLQASATAITTADSGPGSPAAGMMASLLAETAATAAATGLSAAHTPWWAV